MQLRNPVVRSLALATLLTSTIALTVQPAMTMALPVPNQILMAQNSIDPLSTELYSKVGDSGARNMVSQVTLQRSGPSAGQLDVTTRTRTAVKLAGFTGGVFVLLKDASGRVIGVSDLRQFGVDGKLIGRYDRTDFWQERFDPQVAAATTEIQIIQQQAPKNRIPAIVSQINQLKQQACQVYPIPGVCG